MAVGAAVKQKAEITERIETLCRSLDDSLLMRPSPPKTLEQWKNYLKKLIIEQRPRTVLILDDVWEPAVLQAFDVRCTVVITTQDAGVHSCVTGPKEELVLSEGFTEEQSLRALSRLSETPQADLPPEAARIHHLSSGCPLVVSLIGGLLRDFGQRWEYYVRQLKEGNLKNLSNVRDAIHLSVQELPVSASRDALLSTFSCFVVFDQGAVLSSKILGMLEGCCREEIEDRMRVLTQRHLAILGCQSEDRCQTYRLHDLVYNYLVSERKDVTKSARMCNEFRALMPFNRFKSCRSDMIQTSLCLPKSSPVFQKALTSAQSSQECFFVTDIADRRPTVFSVTHRPSGKYATCAKLLPNGREIVTAGYGGQVQITDIIEGKVHTLIHGHPENVTDVSISHDGSRLATCSSLKGVTVWDFSQTDRQLPCLTEKAIDHGASAVVRCCFVRCDDVCKLVTADVTGCLKVWSLARCLEHSFQAHKTAILSCSSCDVEGTVLTCAASDDTVKIYNVREGCEMISITHAVDLCGCSYLRNGLIVTLVSHRLQVFNSKGRPVCRWTREEHATYDAVSCSHGGSRGHFIAVKRNTGHITILRLGQSAWREWKLTMHCQLNVGGVYRDVINMWLSWTEGGIFLVTNQDCGLILVWKLEKERRRPRIDRNVFDASFGADGNLERVVGRKIDRSGKCVIVHPCQDKALAKSTTTTLYKVKNFEAIDNVTIAPVDSRYMISCTTGGVEVSKLPSCLGTRTGLRHEFRADPSQQKVILARLIGRNAHHLLTVSSGNAIAIEVWLREKAAPVSNYHVPFVAGLSADLSHDQSKIAVGCPKNAVMLFFLSGVKLEDRSPKVLEVDSSRVTSCAFSADDKLLAVAGDNSVTVVDVCSFTPVAQGCMKSVISGLSFRPSDDRLLVVAGSTLSIRDARTLRVEGTGTAYAKVEDFHFSADGKMLVTAGAVKYYHNGYIEWWRVDPAGRICELQKYVFSCRVARVVCNQSFTTFVTADEVGEIYVLRRVPSAAPCTSLPRNMSETGY
ncbi:uncharacterized protein [Diadema antillarum]|uniref:uncharacterized protein n=1 Tax=Diadema antillarum TaxID=105358 RepID=UPI003A83E1DA